jgi:hypothetical protein
MLLEIIVAFAVIWLLYKLYKLHYPFNYDTLIGMPHEPFLPILGSQLPIETGGKLKQDYLKEIKMSSTAKAFTVGV